MNLVPRLHSHKSKHIFQKTLKLNWRCQHLISHTLPAIPRGTIIQNNESQASSFLRDPLFFCPFSSFKIPPTKYYINLCLALWTASIPDAVSEYVHLSYRISQITYLHEWAAGSLLHNRHYCFILLLAELYRLASSKFAIFHNVNPKTGRPFTSALWRDWGK